jgi:hypothetical protein
VQNTNPHSTALIEREKIRSLKTSLISALDPPKENRRDAKLRKPLKQVAVSYKTVPNRPNALNAPNDQDAEKGLKLSDLSHVSQKGLENIIASMNLLR